MGGGQSMIQAASISLTRQDASVNAGMTAWLW